MGLQQNRRSNSCEGQGRCNDKGPTSAISWSVPDCPPQPQLDEFHPPMPNTPLPPLSDSPPYTHPWKTQSRTVVYDSTPWLVVENHVIELPNGHTISDWTWVRTPDFVNVVVEMADGTFQFFRQWKYGFDRISLAPIGGYLEPHEAPLDAAKRELLEEMGCEAVEWHDLGCYRVDANRGAGMGHLFLARGARQVAAPSGGDLEEQTLLRLGRAEVLAALHRGDFRGMPWAANVALALLHPTEGQG